MPAVINSEKYNGLSSLKANAGDWVDGESSVSIRFAVGSGNSNKFTYDSFGGNHTLTLDSGDLGDVYGFVVGDVITITYRQLNLPLPQQPQTHVVTITYVSGNTIYLSAALIILPPATEQPAGQQFPAAGVTTGV